MSNPYLISVFIIALNEADRIGAVIDAVRDWVDEIIVIDSGSTDDTVAVAEAKGARVMFNAWQGYGPQKRFGEEQCQHDWILNLDADEVVSPELTEEIQQLFSSPEPPHADGYSLNIADCLPGEALPSRFAHTTVAVRLYNKTKGRYVDSTVHDRVAFDAPNAKIKQLRGGVWHYSVRSISHALEKLNRYSSMQAEDIVKKGKKYTLFQLRLIVEFPIAFFKSYILRLDILRGRRGFINAMTYAFSRFVRLAKVSEMRDR